LGHQTCKNRWPYNLYCVGADVKPCSVNQTTLYTIHVICIWRMSHPRHSVAVTLSRISGDRT